MTTDFLARMRTALGDLPSEQCASLLAEANAEVAQVAAEVGLARLVDRLGTPESYARKLRASLGYTEPPPKLAAETEVIGQRRGPAGPRAPSTGAARLLLVGLTAATLGGVLLGLVFRTNAIGLTVPLLALTVLGVAACVPAVVRGSEEVRAAARLPELSGLLPYLEPDESNWFGLVLGYVYSLQPAWWLVRAVVPMAVLAEFTGHGGLLALLAGIPASVVSIALGRGAKSDRRLLPPVVAFNAFAAGLVLSLIRVAG
ncbi:hypothetical protein GCM10010174_45820 [Kutzneria viridogrisea]|uniref:Uncharacterized protein n=2 Tax=Kutzneria TaxID=43356 RepID=W5WHP5_9PSEU|nr:hypothetical protein [Kutzneria albida]AHI00709.1 hypothetical protein KALB_7351 [Kutzneria albida DSM 43870]MBA8925982.1 F0F1-type ATP synthase assembly protein I [Kutzneria viridogrisea]